VLWLHHFGVSLLVPPICWILDRLVNWQGFVGGAAHRGAITALVVGSVALSGASQIVGSHQRAKALNVSAARAAWVYGVQITLHLTAACLGLLAFMLWGDVADVNWLTGITLVFLLISLPRPGLFKEPSP
jgi:hypothetical protein